MVNGKVQKNAKVRPPTRTIVKRNAAPRKRTQPYSRDTRLAAILRYANGAEDATVQQLRQLSQYPVRRTIRRYRRKITREGTTTSIVTMGTFVLTSFVAPTRFSYHCMSNASLMPLASKRLHSCIEQPEHGTMRARLQRQNNASDSLATRHLLMQVKHSSPGIFSNVNTSGILLILGVLWILIVKI